jgi:hypothetical protein
MTKLEESRTEHWEARLPSVSSVAGFNERRSSTTEDVYSKLIAAIPDLAQLTSAAKAAIHAEHKMTVLEGLRHYPKAIGWSGLVSLAIVMEGYDVNLLNPFFVLPEFKKHYGEPLEMEVTKFPPYGNPV